MKTILALIVAAMFAATTRAGERAEHFDNDPNWAEVSNRIAPQKAVQVTQDFGYSATDHAGKSSGEMGGRVTRAAEPACYADAFAPKTLRDRLSASGSFALTHTSSGGGVFFGFFRREQPGATGRPISSLGMNIDCEKSGARLAVRLITGKNQSCGTFITPYIPGHYRPTTLRNDGTRYTWTLDYDPQGASGRGQFKFTLHGDSPRPGDVEFGGLPDTHKQEAARRFPFTTTFTVDLPEGYKDQNTVFDRFGMMNAMKPGGQLAIYFDDLRYNGRAQDFLKEPNWDAAGNRRTYRTTETPGAQDFGFSDTHFASGEKKGELGGTFWRTEGPVASCADRVGPLSLDDRLVARGKIAFLVGSPDSGMFIGWFDSKTVDQEDGLKDFIGVRVEGPTCAGHYFAPVVATSEGILTRAQKAPVLVPAKTPRTWSIEYDPRANAGAGVLVAHLDNESITLNLKPRGGHNARLDRFGVFTPRVGGSQIKLYLDDLTYTATRDR